MNGLIQSYMQADVFGRLIFLSLLFLSIASWSVIIYKCWVFYKINQLKDYYFKGVQQGITVLQPFTQKGYKVKDPFLPILNISKITTDKQDDYQDSLDYEISHQVEKREDYLFILSTTVTLAPFIGLLGTVWGILITCSQLSSSAGGLNQGILSGLAMALSTTVVGLVIAIPALIACNYLKDCLRNLYLNLEEYSKLLTDMC